MVEQFYFETDGFGIYDITEKLREVVADSPFGEGTLVAFVPHATAALIALENEGGLVDDFVGILEKWVPADGHYAHDRIDDNARSHLLAALLGPSLSLPFSSRSLILGTWQQVFLADLDNRPRRRRIVLQLHKA